MCSTGCHGVRPAHACPQAPPSSPGTEKRGAWYRTERPMSRLELAARPATPLGTSLAKLESLVSPYVGVVRGADEVLALTDDMLAPNVLCQTGYCRELVGAGDAHRGAGAGPTIAAARAAALGEA